MKRYIAYMKENHAPHERRQHAVRVAGVLTAALFAVWVGTLGVRLSSPAVVAEDDQTSLSAAAAASTQNKGALLEVSTTSVYSQ